MRTNVKGELFMIEEDESNESVHSTVRLFVEDDEVWHEVLTFSSYWLDDLMDVLKRLKEKKTCH